MNIVKDASSGTEWHLREANHRMKNHLTLLAGILSLQKRQACSEGASAQFEAMAKRIMSLAHLYDQLSRVPCSGTLDLARYVEDLVTDLRESLDLVYPNRIELNVEPCTVGADLAAELGLILTELITNACKHGRNREGTLDVAVHLRIDDGEGELICADRGAGPPADQNMDNTLGIKIIRALVAGIKGKMEIQSSEGTRFIIHFPVA